MNFPENRFRQLTIFNYGASRMADDRLKADG